jgi:REP element-mobilizing transposase RayT
MLRRGYRHLRKGRFSETGRIYLLTTVTRYRRRVFRDFYAGRILVRALIAEERAGQLESLAYVVMPDHLHWLIRLCDGADLSVCMQRTKSLSARELNNYMGTAGQFWQDGYHDRALRRDEDLVNMARYVVANPLRSGLARSVGEYALWDAVWI